MADGGRDEGGRPELRVGDAERQAALRALDAHLEAGRLSVDEYGDRSAAAVTAVVASDLADLFADLPAPHPPLPERAGAPALPAVADDRPVPRMAPPAALALAVLVMALFALPALVAAGAGGNAFILLPALLLVFGGLHRRGR